MGVLIDSIGTTHRKARQMTTNRASSERCRRAWTPSWRSAFPGSAVPGGGRMPRVVRTAQGDANWDHGPRSENAWKREP